MTRIYNPTTALNKLAGLQYAYNGYQLRFTAAIKALVWSRGGK